MSFMYPFARQAVRGGLFILMSIQLNFSFYQTICNLEVLTFLLTVPITFNYKSLPAKSVGFLPPNLFMINEDWKLYQTLFWVAKQKSFHKKSVGDFGNYKVAANTLEFSYEDREFLKRDFYK